jgi:OOP family OmpA-OmpF porin
MKRGKKTVLSVLIVTAVLTAVFAVQAVALEVITKQDIIEKRVTKDQLVKLVDNFVVLFDASESMNYPYKEDKSLGETKYDVAKTIMKQRENMVPDLGYTAGLYLYTPWNALYPAGSFDQAKYAAAIDSLPPKATGPTPMVQGLHELGKVLAGLKGRTAVFMFTDGTYTDVPGLKDPETKVKELVSQYDVCFYFISSATRKAEQRLLRKMASFNECSVVVPFDWFIRNPDHFLGALFTVKSTVDVTTVTEEKIAGVRVGAIHFDFNKFDVKPEYQDELNKLGKFLKEHPKASAVMAGFTDSIGSREYNLSLSHRRVQSVANYLQKNFGIPGAQIVMHWFGKENPVASNDTEAGRAKNRRVEVNIALNE